MSEEEKKAIDKLSGKQNETTWVDTIRQIKREEIADAVITRQKYITTILNLIDKQQKEIEEYKTQEDLTFECLDKTKYMSNFISKDKIREKIKYLEDLMILFTNDKEKFNRYKYTRDTLDKLLEE